MLCSACSALHGVNPSSKNLVLVMYYLTKFDDIIQSVFWVIPKLTSANLCKPIHDIINYFTFILLNLKIVERNGKNHKHLNISKTKRAFKMKWKAVFIVFEGLSFGEKVKNSEHML